ncbi:hypothetical protein [Paenibacillus sp. ACRRX]|uniref:hypothetical protein n=1 Tax=Paenibacillus sp. ACRRX TaxID=2918206 RepID=UPI0031BB1A46
MRNEKEMHNAAITDDAASNDIQVGQEQEQQEQQDGSLKELEAQLEALLTAGEMETEEMEEAARKCVIPRTEVRIQTELDPIVEETRRFRSIAKEVDNRYDLYLKRVHADLAPSDHITKEDRLK